MNRCHYNKNQHVKQGFRLTIHKILTFRSLFPFLFTFSSQKGRPPIAVYKTAENQYNKIKVSIDQNRQKMAQ